MLTPILTIYSDMLGVIGGYLISVKSLGIPAEPYWKYSAQGVDLWQINEGLIKAVFFGAVIGIVSCYKGFRSGAGASGVGRACTESFVASFIAIIIINFFFAQVAKDWYDTIYGIKGIFG
jgi:phospholipid/cholesterol/gamma-HCH transport system permease protein